MSDWKASMLHLLKKRNVGVGQPTTVIENLAVTNINSKFIIVDAVNLIGNRYEQTALTPRINQAVWKKVHDEIDGVVLKSPFKMCVDSAEDITILRFTAFCVESYCDGVQIPHNFDELLNIVSQYPLSEGCPLFVKTAFGHLSFTPYHTGLMDDETEVYFAVKRGEMTLLFTEDRRMLAVNGQPTDKDFLMLRRVGTETTMRHANIINRHHPPIVLEMIDIV